MARVQNYTKKDMPKLLREHDRSARTYANKVDLNRSHMNYTYGAQTSDEVMRKIQKRTTEIMDGGYVQAQTNICTEWSVFCPVPLINAGREREFFDELWKFCGERYGEENLIAGYVHMDETTPHMHMMFVPEATSRKTGKKTVSSASLMTKTECSSFHTDFDKRCAEVFGISHLVRNGKTIANGLTAENLAQVQEYVGKQYEDTIKAYREFLGKIEFKKIGKTALELFDEKQAAKNAPQKPTESPKKPSEEQEQTTPKRKVKKAPEEPKKEPEASADSVWNTSMGKYYKPTDYAALKRAAQAREELSVSEEQDEKENSEPQF